MDDEYDVIVLGTGLKECILSGLLSVEGKKVLHMDRNEYYGAASTSITPLQKLYTKYGKGEPPESMGQGRKWNVDLIPKFIMANGTLVKMLIYTDVTRYLEFKSVEGSYVWKKGGKVYKVPANQKEAATSSLVTFMEKFRFKSLVQYVVEFDANNEATWKGLHPQESTMQECYVKFGVDQNTIEFVGHAIALYTDDEYLTKPMGPTIDRIQLYTQSVQRYGSSPYLYPLYGLGELPQGFARLSAIYGGTYMLAKPVEQIVYDDAGHVTGVTSEGETAKAKIVIGDPSYFPDKVKSIGKVVRAICLMDHPLPSTKDSLSAQIIIPGKQCGRKNDIYIGCISHAHNVAADGMFITILSTFVEGDPSKADEELAVGYQTIGPVLEKFVSVDDLNVPTDDGSKSGVFITESYDATSHFDTTCQDIMATYKRITGKDLDLTKKESEEAAAAQ